MKKMSKTIGIFILGAIASLAINVAAEAVISSGAVSYSNTTVSAALDELFSAVDINEKIGDMTEISSIGNGTITGAINAMNNTLANNTSSIVTNTNAITELKNVTEKYIRVSYNGHDLGIIFYKYGRVCMAHLNNNISAGVANSEVTIYSSIPEVYRPITDIKVLGMYSTSAGTLYYSEIKFTTDGKIVVKNTTPNPISVSGYKLVYITAS